MWTDEEHKELYTLFIEQKFSARKIAKQLGLSRGAIRGRLKRLGWLVAQPPPPSPWSEARLDELKAHVAVGKSSTEIAVLMHLPRGAVTAKATYLGLRFARKSITRATRAEKTKAKTVTGLSTPHSHLPPEGALFGLDVVNLRPHQCRWPIDNEHGTRRVYCQNDQVDSKRPYCPEHVQRMYRKRGTMA